jgi:hypothetical protein
MAQSLLTPESRTSTSIEGPNAVSEERLRRWLGLLRQPDKLATEEIEVLLKAHGCMPESQSPLAIGQAGAQLILNAIERLRPSEDAGRSESLPHEVLTRCFIDGAKLFQAAVQMGLSERQLSRERARAIGLLKAELDNAPTAHRPIDYLAEQIPTIRGFLDRPAEMNRLKKALHSTGLVIVHGAPGIGKTSLVAELVSEASTKLPVLWYRFRPGVNTSLAAVLFEIGAHLRSRNSHDLGEYLDDSLPNIDTALATRLAMRGLGEGAALIVFDDYHLIEDDLPIKGLIEEMVARLPEMRVVAISQHRYLGMVHGTGVEIGPLARLQAAELLAHLGVACSDKMLRSLHSWTNGNPHMLKLAASWLRKANPEQVEEGVASLRDQAEIQDFLLSQVTNVIDPDDIEILKGASIFRSQFSDDALAFVTDKTRGAVVDSSIRLIRAYIATRNRDGDSAFFHNSVRDFVYERLDMESRCRLHGRAAEWFEKEDHAREAAWHRSRCP